MTIALTCGEPAGIGPELCAMAAMRELPCPVVAIGDAELLAQRAKDLDLRLQIDHDRAPESGVHRPGVLPVISTPFATPECIGTPLPENAQTLLDGLNIAVDDCLAGRFTAMVTAPLQKSVISDAGFAFSGHTEYLAQRCRIERPVMLLANERLRVALATTHLPLRAVPDAITTESLNAVIDVLWRDLRDKFDITEPHIAVCGLNPHAGEGGHLGSEDDAIIKPVIEAQQNKGRHVTGPFPADTIFNHAGRNADAILAMYHDQGLPVIKYEGFGSIVNITLGLPIIRTSVDHGSALDIAGTGRADPSSLLAAINAAAQLAA